jgi:hypothetical protein
LLGLAAFAALGCTLRDTRTRGANDVVATRLVGLPSVGTTYVLDVTGNLQPMVDESLASRGFVDTSVNYRLAQSGSRFFGGKTLDLLERYPAFRDWSTTNLREVLLELLSRRKAQNRGQMRQMGALDKRRFAGGLASWRRVLDADFVLLTRFSEAYDVEGRKLRPSTDTGVNWAIACILRLEDGALLWCYPKHTTRAVLSNRSGAQKAVDALLSPMLDRLPGVQPRSSVYSVAPAQATVSPPPPDEPTDVSPPPPPPAEPAKDVDQEDDEEAPPAKR